MEIVEEVSETIEKRKNKLEKWIFGWAKDNYDKAFIVVLIVAFIIRFLIFLKTQNQAIWWDTADYLSVAKMWAGYELNADWYFRRGFLWPFICSLFFRVGLGELAIRFLEVLFSTGIVLVSYLFVKEVFDKKTALLVSMGISVSWVILFFTGRPLTNIPATFLLILSVYFLWKGYVKNQGTKFFYLFGVFYALTVLMRMQYLMFVPIFILFFFIKEKFRFLKNKNLWKVVLIFLILLLPHFIMYWQHYGNPVADIMTYYFGVEGLSETGKVSVSGQSISDIFLYFKNLGYILTNQVLALFIFGALLFFGEVFLGIDKIFKSKRIQKKLFFLIWIVGAFFIMGYIAPNVEQRYIMQTLPFLFLIAVQPILWAERMLVQKLKINPKIALVLVFALFIFLLLPNLNWGNELTDSKVSSYYEIKQAGEWIRDNSPQDSVSLSRSALQIMYYSEKETHKIRSQNQSVFYQELVEKGADFVVLSIYETHPEWLYQYPAENPAVLEPIQAYMLGEQPAVIIYKVNLEASEGNATL